MKETSDKRESESVSRSDAQRLFQQARRLSRSAREQFVKQATDDEDIALEVLQLLDAYEGSQVDVQRIVGNAAASLDSATYMSTLDRIGNYRVLELIDEGGMGQVYLAERADDQFRQKVAIKVLGSRFPNEQLLLRFRTERQILANLDHPNIARLIDGGETEDGRPFLVMEYVDGAPITEYCDQADLSLRQRLRLFRKVCRAIEHAHANLIIHRDIKPSNILVNADGEPKLLDFGIAKLLNPDEFEENVAKTRVAMRLMTPEYASPEQMRGEGVSIATDVYALGALLYELLCGETPFQLGDASPAEVVRVVCDVEPRLPSFAVTVSDAREDVTSVRSKRLRGDLDNIVLLAMRKEPSSRYRTVGELSDDVARYLGGLPVLANRGNWLYVGKKFIARHRGKALAASAVLAALLGGAYVYTTNLAAERDIAQRERETAEEVTEFLVGLFENTNPLAENGGELTARELLARGSERIDKELASRPAIQARLNRIVSSVYSALSLYDESLERATAALRIVEANDSEPADLAESLETLARAQWQQENYDETIRLAKRALDIQESIVGSNHPSLLRVLDLLGTVSYYVDDWEGSAAYYERVVALPDITESNRLVVMGNYTITLEALDRYEEAERTYLESIRLRESHYGADHPRVANSLANYGSLLIGLDRHAEAGPHVERALRINLDSRGRDSASVAYTTNLLAIVAREAGDLELALSHDEESVDIWHNVTGPGHSRYASALISLATTHEMLGNLEEARATASTALDVMVESHGSEHTYAADAHNALGRVHFAMEDYSAAEAQLRRAYDIWQTAGMAYRHVVKTEHLLGRALLAQESFSAAEPHLAAVVDYRESEDPVDASALADSLNDRAAALDGLNRNSEAQATRDRANGL